MKTLLIIITSLALTHPVTYSQNRPDSIHNCGTIVSIIGETIANETKLVYNKTDAIIYCYNEAIAKKIINAHQQLLKQYKFSWIDNGIRRYKEYVIFFQKEDSTFIKKWAKTNLSF